MTKKCGRCGEAKGRSEFYARRGRKNGLMSVCKECAKELRKEYFATRTDKERERDNSKQRDRFRNTPGLALRYLLKKEYGLTTEQYNALVESQGGVCKICGNQPNVYGRLAVDHCHTTEVIRGLLCKSCNIGLGEFRDNPHVLRRAAEYLEEFYGKS